MTPQRLIRDSLILLVVGGVLFGVYQTVALLNANRTPELNEQAFSDQRRASDVAFLSNRWEDALAPHDELVAADPYNGTAWFRLGFSHWKLLQTTWRELAEEEAKVEGNPERLEALRSAVLQREERAIKALQQAASFSQFRNDARRIMAEIYLRKRDLDQAFRLLSEAVEDGYCTRAGLERDETFLPLKTADAARFQKLLDQEKANLEAAKFRSEQLSSATL